MNNNVEINSTCMLFYVLYNVQYILITVYRTANGQYFLSKGMKNQEKRDRDSGSQSSHKA